MICLYKTNFFARKYCVSESFVLLFFSIKTFLSTFTLIYFNNIYVCVCVRLDHLRLASFARLLRIDYGIFLYVEMSKCVLVKFFLRFHFHVFMFILIER